MRVVVTGATGNVGTSVIDAFSRDPAIESIVGIARRIPDIRPPKVRWLALDVRNGVRRGVAVVRLRKALLQARSGERDPAALPRAVVPRVAAPTALRARVSRARAASLSGRAFARRG